MHVYLTELAETLQPGESGLIALDWWNGNRSVLTDYDLTGLIVGMTLSTRPEEIYRALIEATAYGTRMIVENFVRHGVPVTKFVATGGISQKNTMAMQIYADVLNMPVHIADGKQGGALGAACFAAVAAGKAAGGYDSITEAAAVMGRQKDAFYAPIPEHAAVYETLYREYGALHDYFGRGGSDVMKRLKAIRTKIKGLPESAKGSTENFPCSLVSGWIVPVFFVAAGFALHSAHKAPRRHIQKAVAVQGHAHFLLIDASHFPQGFQTGFVVQRVVIQHPPNALHGTDGAAVQSVVHGSQVELFQKVKHTLAQIVKTKAVKIIVFGVFHSSFPLESI